MSAIRSLTHVSLLVVLLMGCTSCKNTARRVDAAEDAPLALPDELFDALPPAGNEYEEVAYTPREAERLWRELEERAQRNELSYSDREKLASGTRFDKYSRLRSPYREIAEHMRAGGTLSDRQWQRLLVDGRVFVVRKRWPAETPVAISMVEPGWLPGYPQITATPEDPKLGKLCVGETFPSTCGTYTAWREQDEYYQFVGQFPPGRHSVRYNAEIELGEGHFLGDISERTLWRGSIDLEFEVVGSIDEAVPPIDSPELCEAIRSSIGFGVRRWATGTHGFVNIDVDASRYPALTRLGVFVKVDLLRSDEIIDTAFLRLSHADELLNCNSVYKQKPRLYSSWNYDNFDPGDYEDEKLLAAYSLRVQGTSEHVLDLWHADERWGGSFTMPLADAVAQEKKRAPRGPEVSTPRHR